ncbi:MAG: glycosyltransferase [Pirellulaceae bacterium]|nr:glycosyltransferase [Pirellulaceae bacterium]
MYDAESNNGLSLDKGVLAVNERRPRVHLMSGLLEGGAANGAKRLLANLREQGVDARLHYPPKYKPKGVSTMELDDAGIEPLHWRLNPLERLTKGIGYRIHRERFKRQVRNQRAGMEIFTSPMGAPCTRWPPATIQRQHGDIIHLHWVARFIDYESFFRSLPKGQPVVWTLHDMNPFTGGCHFTDGCEQFTTACGNCPQLPHPRPDDISHRHFGIKRDALRDVNLHIVTVSRWMQQQAKRSAIFDHVRSYHRIAYGLAPERFEVVDRSAARRELGIDPDAFVFSFGAADVRNRRKGFGLLMQSLQQIGDVPNAMGLVFGHGELPAVEHPIPPIRSMGYVTDVKRMMLIYSACDVSILPSTQDNLPFTGLESLASGTPVVAFDAGGVPDLVRPHQTGLLAPNFDAVALGKQIRYMAEHRDEAAAMGRMAREVALAEYSHQREAKEYAQLYATLLAEGDAAD